MIEFLSICVFFWLCRNPLKSGQGFLLDESGREKIGEIVLSRNPLKSGQCFLINVNTLER